ncbi:MAG: (Fe-S)-binding protein [Eubacteriales bacterium]
MKEKIAAQIKEYVVWNSENRLMGTDIPYYGEPLVGFASADDPLFEEFKTAVGPMHMTPREAFDRSPGLESFAGGTVVSVVLPVSEDLRASNRQQKEWPSREWALLRSFGDGVFLPAFTAWLKELFTGMGYRTVAPAEEGWFKIERMAGGIASNWSQRHIAYAAGLGTFSLNEGFITEKGIAVKFTSVVTECRIEPDKRTARNHLENCLYYRNGTCGACIRRCPVGAITKEKHDKFVCYERCYGEGSRKVAEAFGGNPEKGAGCGLCQTNVPCEFIRP